MNHRDEREPNMLWSEECRRVMFIDFNRAAPPASCQTYATVQLVRYWQEEVAPRSRVEGVRLHHLDGWAAAQRPPIFERPPPLSCRRWGIRRSVGEGVPEKSPE